MSNVTDLLGIVKQTLTEQTNQANAIAAKIAASKHGQGGLVHELAFEDETVTDKTVLAFREWVNKLDAAREAKVEEVYAYIKANLMSTEAVDVEALTEQYKALKDQIKSGVNYVKVADPNFTEETLADVPELVSLRGGTVSTSGTKGETKRPRIAQIWVNGEPINGKGPKGQTVSNLTTLAQYMAKDSGTKVEVKDLQMNAFAAAGTDDFKTLNGNVFEFSVNAGDKSYSVKVQPAVTNEKVGDKVGVVGAEGEVVAPA